ncbi:unnamed protein product [Nyctereutes procyonoides]|uniref:(raccoon dog) hypothetical protein n=1 Tax=Nyctereutes procyonoides TaxID=34880 RepID=A0A811YVK2_NYCPR|nr:unnamed protein product [Nyctereutes procyonoides]
MLGHPCLVQPCQKMDVCSGALAPREAPGLDADFPETSSTSIQNHVPAHDNRVRHMPEWPPGSVEQLASAPVQYPEPPQQPAPAPTSGPAKASGPEVIELVTARTEMPAAETKPMHVVVIPLTHCSDMQELLVPVATLEEEHAQVHAIGFPHMPEQPPASLERTTLATELHPEPNQEPATETTVRPAEASGDGILPNSFYEATITLSPKADKDPTPPKRRVIERCPR